MNTLAVSDPARDAILESGIEEIRTTVKAISEKLDIIIEANNSSTERLDIVEEKLRARATASLF